MKKLLYIPLALVVLLSACSPIYYSPTTHNVPVISEKDQFSGTLAGNGNQYEVQAAYGVGKHTGVQVNGGLFLPKDLDNGNGGSGKFGEAGVGYFSKLGNSFVFETYALVGFGGVENHMPTTVDSAKTTTGNINAGISRYSIQPAFGFVTANFSLTLSARLSSLNYSNVTGSLNFLGEDQVAYLKNNSSMFLAEPAITARLGTGKLQFQAQLGNSINLTNSSFRQDKGFITLGLNVRLQTAD